MLSKANYQIHTDAIKAHIIPQFPIKREWAYADEADLLNMVMLGCSAKQWREQNPERAANGENIRDSASINELIILSNLETHNALFIKEGLPQNERAERLLDIAHEQMRVLHEKDERKSIKKVSDTTYIDK